MKCEICKKTLSETPLYRNGPLGKPVPWRCLKHLDPEYMPNEETASITNLIHKKGHADE